MFNLIQSYLPDFVLELWLVVMLGVAIVSSMAWVVSRRIWDNPALKHLVLFCGLLACLAMPMLAWLAAAANVTLVSLPVLGGEHGIEPPARVRSEEDHVDEYNLGAEREAVPAEMPSSDQLDRTLPQLSSDEPPLNADLISPQTTATADEIATTAVAVAASQTEPPRAPAAVAEAPSEARVSPRRIAGVAMFLWAVGVVLMLVRLAWNCVGVVQLRRSSKPAANKRVQRLLREVTDQLGVGRPVLLLFSSRAVAPLACGLLRRVIILPHRLLDSINDVELRDVLVHEIAHLRRGDQRIVFVQELAAALYWPIVTVHGLNRELRRAREELCDNVVLASRDPVGYGETLLHVAQLLVQPRSIRTAVGIFGGPSELERRITGLIDPRRNIVTTVRRKTACLVVCVFVAAGAIVSGTRLATSADAAQPSTRSSDADAGKNGETNSTQSEPATDSAPANEDQQSAPDSDAVKRAGHFTGQVTGPDGSPVEGAKIYMVPYSGFRSTLWSGGGSVLLNPLESIGSVRASTDADGRFKFDAPDMVYTTLEGEPATRQGLLVAAADGYAPDWIEKIRFRSDPPQLRKLDLQLSELAKPIQGRLLDPNGGPLVKARVQLARVMIPERRNLDAHLAEVRARDGSLIEYLRDLEQPDLLPGIETETWTDGDGRFSLSGVGRDWIAILKIEDPAVVTTNLAVMTRDAPAVDTGGYYHGVAGEKPAGLKADAATFASESQGSEGGVIYAGDFTYQLQAGRTVRGRVVDRDTGKGIAGMWVGPVQNYRAGVSSRLYPWTTDEEGRFTITGLPQKMPQEDEVVMAVAPPGVPYQMAGEWITGNEEILIKCPRGIPFRLKVVDEQGQAVSAEVTYIDVQPNPHVQMLIPRPEARYHWPFAPAARIADGTYEGFVMPGPGAVLINLPEVAGYRPAHVDPKAFFAPRRKEWTEHDEWAYGTDDTLTTSNEERRVLQHEYEAIVLVNPAPGSEPLELSATVFKDRPRQVYFVDTEGNPVHNISWTRYGQQYYEHQLPLRGLHPDRLRPLIYYQEDRRLVGFLLARGDDDAPYTVLMQRWGTITGRVLDENGNALTGSRISVAGDHPADSARQLSGKTDENGRFAIGKLIPGHRYTGKVLRGDRNVRGRLVPLFAGMAFEDVVLRPGGIRNLGDIRTKPPTYEEFPLDYQD